MVALKRNENAPSNARSAVDLARGVDWRDTLRGGAYSSEARRAYEQNLAAVRHCLVEEHPQVQRQVKEEGAEVH
jgi:hypothetical protein